MATTIPFKRDLSFEYGVLEDVAPNIRRLVANNPGPFTFYGTGTYVIGKGKVAVIDAGPDLEEHVQALLTALENEEITHQLITHTHRDHSPAAKAVREATGAKTYGYGPHGEGRYERGVKVEAGGDMDFKPDVKVRHGDVIEGDGWSVECVHTPGHCSNHICFQLREHKALFSGDHVMGWSTSIISPPDGDMADYMTSLELLLKRDDRILWPTHGAPIDDPKPFVSSFIAHRLDRERQITACMADGLSQIEEMVPLMYRDLKKFMYPAAARSVLAHMIHMRDRGLVVTDGEPSLSAIYRVP